MNNKENKQWYFTTKKGTMKLPKNLSKRKAMQMAARNSVSSGDTELHDEERILVYIFKDGRMHIGREKVASTNPETRKAIKAENTKETASPRL